MVIRNNTLSRGAGAVKATREELAGLLDRGVASLTEDDALSILDHPFVTSAIIQKLAQDPRLSSFYAVRLRLVAHRKTPQMYAAKLVHYLHWPDLVRLSVDVMVPAPVRRAIDTQLLARVTQLTLGERIASARRCSQALIKHFLFDPDPRVFAALLVNQRLREDEILALIASERATRDQIALLANDIKWSFRYAIRRALVLNASTPRSIAAAQLRHLTLADLRNIYHRAETSVYLRRCIERLRAETVAKRLR
ncbi:MAG TPA: hypothetical protein VH087_05095 [Thermoanaerobaculia bacterium]|jgi:hypothetical protein|nr:hypothetical protein [Thermoanaerobaculia bacterium]